jgi:XTP/dITP diphosphohydrolase
VSAPGAVPALLVASFNPAKARELRALVEAAGYEVVTLADIGGAAGEAPGVAPGGATAAYEEAGATYEENGAGKARHYARLSGRVTIADDSGIEVDALGGRPGVQSARYGGPDLDEAGRNRLLLEELRGVPEEKRTARYVAVAVVARPDGATRAFRGICEGRITEAPRGAGGFGYDPLFLHPPFGVTFAEVEPARKHEVSHRGRALRALAAFLAGPEGRRFLGPDPAPGARPNRGGPA